MKIADIIQKESDRIFIVDPGCFIIFTGNSLEDSQPFIRIGNWYNMPVQLIPLIENIIVTDSLTGNPALEQFNINIDYQSSNRYIGSHYTLRKFLEFQKIFGLDLQSVTVVDVENDIPEINSRTISDRETFIGVFYRNGNFRITHNGKSLFDLHNIQNKTCNIVNILNDLYENCRGRDIYTGSGFIFHDDSRLFYSDNRFYVADFPGEYRSFFDRMNINPKKIEVIAQESANYIPLAEFTGWLNANESRCTLLSDDKAALSVFKKLFSSAQLNIQSLTSSDMPVGQELFIKEVDGFNRLVTLQKPEGSVNCLFLAPGGQHLKLLQKGVNAVFIPASMYEECAMVLKSTGISAAVIDDGHKAFKKISSLSERPIYKNIRYSIRPFFSTDECLSYFSQLTDADDLIRLFASDQKECVTKIEDFLNSDTPVFNKINFMSLIRYLKNITSNRRMSSQLSRLLQTYGMQYSVENLVSMKIPFRAEIVLADNGVFQTFFPIPRQEGPRAYIPEDGIFEAGDDEEYTNIEEIASAARTIAEDRERLQKLIDLYAERAAEKRKEEISSLESSIETRKTLYSGAYVSREDVETINEKISPSSDGGLISGKGEVGAQEPETLVKSFFHKYIFDKFKYRLLKARREKLQRHDSETEETPPTLKDYVLFSLPVIILRSLHRGFAIIVAVCVALLIILSQVHVYLGELSRRYVYTDEGTDNVASTIEESDSSGVLTGEDEDNAPGNVSAAEDADVTDNTVLESRVSGEENHVLIDRYNIGVTDREVFEYVNKIAELNGYRPILLDNVRGKNPHWIFPDNVFVLPDGERFMVREGDSLWKIAELKLTRLSIEFFKAIEEIEKAADNGGPLPDDAVMRAEKAAYRDSYKKKLESVLSSFR